MIITAVTGLPGSGKSHYAKELSKKTGQPVVDDPKTPGGRSTMQDDLIELALRDKKDVIVVDPGLVHDKMRDKFRMLLYNWYCEGAKIEWVFFENDPEACRENVTRRQDAGDTRNVEPSIKLLSKVYSQPTTVSEIRPVWRRRQRNILQKRRSVNIILKPTHPIKKDISGAD